ncbi:thioredoxin domain-containing protein [Rhizosaccharibacter radicis]|uniref:DsbA family protein n=1 Tax=Rhizosaccharibacter radicis TaxID=2782605 RepID=A0ABT1VUL3_9PROT|nr:DsbA family protein [Acetobacteraceae bacterium KSS12]
MSIRRRTLLAASPALLLGGGALFGGVLAAGAPARAAAGADPRMADRALGKPDAKLVVQEWFSLTCTHCARFAQVVFPEVKQKLIDTGRIRYVFKDYPLDQVALLAAMVARALPPERYEPFVMSLLASQDRWAFAPNADPQAELAKMAALAGMSHELFQKTIADDGLKQAILDEQDRGVKQFKIDSTPSFLFGSKLVTGEMDYDTFLKNVTEAGA